MRLKILQGLQLLLILTVVVCLYSQSRLNLTSHHLHVAQAKLNEAVGFLYGQVVIMNILKRNLPTLDPCPSLKKADELAIRAMNDGSGFDSDFINSMDGVKEAREACGEVNETSN